MDCTNLTTLDDKRDGFVYLVQPVTLKNTNRFKIGCSKNLNLSRLKAYLNDVRYVCIFAVDNPFVIEKEIKNNFNTRFTQYAGNEYYEGDETQMTITFLSCLLSAMDKCKNLKDTPRVSKLRLDIAHYHKFNDDEKDSFWIHQSQKFYSEIRFDTHIEMLHRSKLVDAYKNASSDLEKSILWSLYDQQTQMYCDYEKFGKTHGFL